MSQQKVKSAKRRRAAEPPVIDLENYVPAYLTFIANKWSRSASRLYLSRFGIGIEAWRIMVLLAIEGRITANRIRQVIFMDKASVSRSLRTMHERGLIALTENPADARQRFVELTQPGFEIHDQIIGLALAREERLLACLSDEERRTLVGLLLKIHGNLNVLDADLAEGTPSNGEAE